MELPSKRGLVCSHCLRQDSPSRRAPLYPDIWRATQGGAAWQHFYTTCRLKQIEHERPSRDMAVPIQQLTTNNEGTHNRERVPFTLIGRKEKCGDTLYEKRHYGKANWACITVHEDTYEQSICLGFMKLMRYICQQNSSGSYLGLTIPIVTVVRTDDAHSVLSRAVTVAYYLPTEHQARPPAPYDADIIIEEWPATIVYTRAFPGATNEQSIISEISALAEMLELPALCLNDSFIVAGYTNPAAANRQNEIWFLEQH
uniref:Heme-binding protein soul3 n=1 Tax=Scleropages formosus TaxID=113540 RepID=A0A8C9TTE2_SCLFO